MEEIWCEECGARFREECACGDMLPVPAAEDRWVGMDGHAYVGDRNRSSLAWHDTERCRCPQGERFDPDSWY